MNDETPGQIIEEEGRFIVIPPVPFRDVKIQYFRWCVARHGGNQSAAEREIEVSQRTITKYIEGDK